MKAPELAHFKEWQEIIPNYRPSQRALDVIKDLKLVLMLSPSASGRNTIIRELVDNHGFFFIVSDTTRPPQVRDGKLEQDGVQYYFRREEEMLADLKRGEFLEAEIIHGQQVSGMSIRELEKAKKLNKVAITDIEVLGALNVKKLKSDTFDVLLLPPSFEEWQRRMASRSYMSKKEYARRFETAITILKTALENYFFQIVIAENVGKSAVIMKSIVSGAGNPDQERGKKLLKKLAKDFSNHPLST